jgi:GTPase SAR1 family protein
MSKSQAILNHDALLERSLELDLLRQRISQRKSLLLFGDQGVGKTRLLQQVVSNNKDVLYIAKGHAPREFLLTLIEAFDQPHGTRSKNLQDSHPLSRLQNKRRAGRSHIEGRSLTVAGMEKRCLSTVKSWLDLR